MAKSITVHITTVVADGEDDFVAETQNKVISKEDENLINVLLFEKFSLAGISKVANTSGSCPQSYVH